jgi:hypothetical protein
MLSPLTLISHVALILTVDAALLFSVATFRLLRHSVRRTHFNRDSCFTLCLQSISSLITVRHGMAKPLYIHCQQAVEHDRSMDTPTVQHAPLKRTEICGSVVLS